MKIPITAVLLLILAACNNADKKDTTMSGAYKNALANGKGRQNRDYLQVLNAAKNLHRQLHDVRQFQSFRLCLQFRHWHLHLQCRHAD